MFAFHFFAVVMHVPRLGTCQVPMRHETGIWNQDQSWVVFIFFCVLNRSPLAQGTQGNAPQHDATRRGTERHNTARLTLT